MDEFVQEQMDAGQAIWVATLNTGEVVHQDENRPGLASSAWLRLKIRCEAEGLFVTQLGLRFRSHEERPLPDNADGYWFCRSALGSPGTDTIHFYLVGWLAGRELSVEKWQVPELILVSHEKRENFLAECLIERLEG